MIKWRSEFDERPFVDHNIFTGLFFNACPVFAGTLVAEVDVVMYDGPAPRCLELHSQDVRDLNLAWRQFTRAYSGEPQAVVLSPLNVIALRKQYDREQLERCAAHWYILQQNNVAPAGIDDKMTG